MKKSRAIPQGYMTVGEMAKEMGVSVRTLQYYHREGLLSPSARSEGGRRLYTHKDLLKLHQILSLKHLGFSLQDIKERLVSLDTPQEVAAALAEQAANIQRRIEALGESLRDIELLRAEVLQIQSVDFKKYADIIVNLQMGNEFYWLIKHFDEGAMDHIRSRFDRESGLAFMDMFNGLGDEILALRQQGVAPESEKAQAAAEAFWGMVMEFTQGDMGLLSSLLEAGRFDEEGTGNAWAQKQALISAYIEPALGIYFQRLGINPFEEGES